MKQYRTDLRSSVHMVNETPVRLTYRRRLFRRRTLFAVEFWTKRPADAGYQHTIIKGR